MADQILVVYVTAPKGKKAKALAKAIIQSRTAACVNVIPAVESFYRWKGKVHHDPEALLVIKTRKSRLKALEKTVMKNHPYDTPEFIALPVSAGSRAYVNWVKKETA